jgi:alpha-tubulin suppressor-like RCC1 family protein
VKCWGENDEGEVGNGTETDPVRTPVAVKGLSGVTAIGLGSSHACALLADTSVKCWGITSYRWGNEEGNSSTPVAVKGLSGVTAITIGGSHSCALLADTSVKCWGENDEGELGTGYRWENEERYSFPPAAVKGLSGVTAIATGARHSCALLADTSVKCWGANYLASLGNDTHGERSLVPVAVKGLSGVTAIGLGSSHSCALLADTSVKCWGYNYDGQLGNGTRENSSVPVAVKGLSGVTAIGLGDGHSCALLADTSVKCWGRTSYRDTTYRDNSQEGNSSTPVAVVGFSK